MVITFLVNPYPLQIVAQALFRLPTMLKWSGLPWLQQEDSGIPQTIQWGHRNPLVLRTSCFRNTTVISHLLKLFLILPDSGDFTLSLYVEHLDEAWLHPQHKAQVQGLFGSGLGADSLPNHTHPVLPFTGASYRAPLSHSLSSTFFFFLSFSCLTGRGCLSVARACMQEGSVKSPCL